MTNFDLIKYPVFTEKSNKLLQLNKYTFLIDKKVNKVLARKLINDLFSVKIKSLNSFLLSSRRHRLGKYIGFKTYYKRLIITLEKGNVIPFSSF
jgi:large subunit ribosomal protein L23